MSDEESFVILGSCSLRSNDSLRSVGSGFGSLEQSKIEMDNVASGAANLSVNDKNKSNETAQVNSLEKSTEKEQTMTDSVNKCIIEKNIVSKDKSYEILKQSIDKNQQKSDEIQKIEIIMEQNATQVMQKSADSQKSIGSAANDTMIRSIGSGSGASAKTDGSLAASFILGEVKADVLKSSVYSQFPSLCSMESCAEDISKLQNFMSEYLELKSTLATVNTTMRQFYNKTQQWRDEMQKTERQYKEQLQNCRHEIATLRNENLNLRQEMNSKMEQMLVSEESQRKEMTQLTQSISEKAALIENMRAEIARLEEKQLASFDYISKHENDTKEHPDYIARSEHLLALKELERKMSEIVAENYELKDMKKIYVDEINCLKVNLTSAEELLSQARRDIDLLKSKDMEKSQLFENYEKEREEMREEMGLLRQQVEVYSKDFLMERTARESLAGEKDQLVQDLRTLQRTNQQLIEEQQLRLSSIRAEAAATNDSAAGTVKAQPQQVSAPFIAKPPSAAAFEANLHQRPIRRLPQQQNTKATLPKPNRFNCPVCSKGFDSLTVLQSHVNMCLDNA